MGRTALSSRSVPSSSTRLPSPAPATRNRLQRCREIQTPALTVIVVEGAAFTARTSRPSHQAAGPFGLLTVFPPWTSGDIASYRLALSTTNATKLYWRGDSETTCRCAATLG